MDRRQELCHSARYIYTPRRPARALVAARPRSAAPGHAAGAAAPSVARTRVASITAGVAWIGGAWRRLERAGEVSYDCRADSQPGGSDQNSELTVGLIQP